MCTGLCVFACGEQKTPFLPLLLFENLAKGPRHSGTWRGPGEGNSEGSGIRFVGEKAERMN